MGPLTLLVVIIVANLILGGIPAAWMAGEKGRSQLNWLIMGGIYGPLAVFFVGLAPMKRDADQPMAAPPVNWGREA